MKSGRHLTNFNVAFEQWQVTTCEELFKASDKYNIVNGYEYNKFDGGVSEKSKTVILVNACFYETIPIDLLKKIKEIPDYEKKFIRVLYTNESPNIRHTKQWDIEFLTNNFDVILTYWDDLINLINHNNELFKFKTRVMFCPYIQGINPDKPIIKTILDAQCNYYNDYDKIKDINIMNKHKKYFEDKLYKLYINEKLYKPDICIVLENRNYDWNYCINDVLLSCLDHYREKYVNYFMEHDLPIATFGKGWKKELNKSNELNKPNDEKDPRYTYEIMRNYTFVLIIENTTANGYVSEKIYDAFVAGCIPLYYGNVNNNYKIDSDMYIDLRIFNTPDKLYNFMMELTNEDIYNYKVNIFNKRKTVLRESSSHRYKECLDLLFK
jgi:hypothetical protein